MFGPVLDDPEFDVALVWAEEQGISEVDQIEKYPFSLIERKKAVQWYATLGKSLGLVPQRSECAFDDTDTVSEDDLQQIVRACQY